VLHKFGIILFSAVIFVSSASDQFTFAAELPELIENQIPSSLNPSQTQPILHWAPETAKNEKTPLLVFLHSWSGNYKQNNQKWFAEAVNRNWIYLKPNFQGPNFQPTACGSELARQEILDAMDYIQSNYQVDSSRIYLAGASGGGHMTLLMAGYYPDRFSAVSAWVGITDLSAWNEFHSKTSPPGKYALNVRTCCGGLPGDSAKIDSEYRARSPSYHLHQVGNLPVDIAAGIHDGHTGSVPIDHSLIAFNVIAKANHTPLISKQFIDHVTKHEKLPEGFQTTFNVEENYPRKVHFRQDSGVSRVTIFEGGHEGLSDAACNWLAHQQRPTSSGN